MHWIYSSCTIILDNSNVFVITGLFKQNVVNIWMVSHMFHKFWYQKRSHTFIHTNNNIGNICLSFRGQSLTTTKTSMRKIKDERKQIFCWWPRFYGQCTEWRITTPCLWNFTWCFHVCITQSLSSVVWICIKWVANVRTSRFRGKKI